MQLITKTKAKVKMKAPPAEVAWKARAGRGPPLADNMEGKSRIRLPSRDYSVEEVQAPHPVGGEIGRNEHTTKCAMTGCLHDENIEH